MGAGVQTFRFEEAVPRIREGVSVRGRGVRTDGGDVKALMYPFDLGIPGLNVRFSFDRVKDGFYSPRHRHNFDQVRCVLSGTINIGKSATLHAGECGYFPEGAFYGPQDQKGDGEVLVMQFPGPDAAYFMLQSEYRAALDRLLAGGGIFENGVYQRTTEDGRQVNQDGFEAVWEAHTGQAVTYSTRRYAEPIIMNPGAFTWRPDECRPGLEIKRLGTFNEYRTDLSIWRFREGAVLQSERLVAPEFRFVLQGEVIIEGKTLPARSALYLPDGVDTGALESPAGAELLVISVPMYVQSVWRRARETLTIRPAKNPLIESPVAAPSRQTEQEVVR
jgi:hypothetical protein